MTNRMIQVIKPAVVGLTILASFVCSANTIKGVVTPLKKDSPVLFNYESTTTKDGDTSTIVSTYTDPESGAVAVREEAKLKDGSVQSYKIEQKQENQSGSIEVTDDKKIKFKLDGKDAATEDWTSRFLVGPGIAPYIDKHWKDLMAGKAIPTRYGVWYRQDTVGFEFTKNKEMKFEGADAVEVKFSPSSWMIAALVDPVYMVFDKNSHRILQTRGRLPVKQKKGDGFADLDATLNYKYEAASAATAGKADPAPAAEVKQ